MKKKKLKINVHRPVGTRVVFDEEGNTQAPLAMLADKASGEILFDQGIHYNFSLLKVVRPTLVLLKYPSLTSIFDTFLDMGIEI